MDMRDPAAIPMLVLDAGRSHSAYSALVTFGRQVLREGMRVAQNEDGTGFHFEIRGYIITLCQMVLVRVVECFTPELRARRRACALTGREAESYFQHEYDQGMEVIRAGSGDGHHHVGSRGLAPRYVT